MHKQETSQTNSFQAPNQKFLTGDVIKHKKKGYEYRVLYIDRKSAVLELVDDPPIRTFVDISAFIDIPALENEYEKVIPLRTNLIDFFNNLHCTPAQNADALLDRFNVTEKSKLEFKKL